MLLPPLGTVLKIRPEVLDAQGPLDLVDLALVSQRRNRGLARASAGMEALADPERFFDLTYPTEDIRQLLAVVSSRLADPGRVQGTVLLAGRYGLGKSHAMLAAHHALSSPLAAHAWAARWDLPDLRFPSGTKVLTRSFIQEQQQPLWEMLVQALGNASKARVGDFPDGEFIESLLGQHRVVLIMDELERWYDSQDDQTKSRNRNFLQALTEVSMRDPRLTVIASVLGERPEPADTIRRARPLELTFRSAEDRQRIVRFRLFDNGDDPSVRETAIRVTDRYLESYRAAHLPELDTLRVRMLATYPFTPEFMELLTRKIPNVSGFQNTRGLLRFLSHVVRHTHRDRPLISSQDIPLDESQMWPLLKAIDTSGGEVVRCALEDDRAHTSTAIPHRDPLISAILVYSLADPTHPGATVDELLQAVLDPGENANEIKDAINRLRELAPHLHLENGRYVFRGFENPNARINLLAESPDADNAAPGIIRDHILETWGAKEATLIHAQGDLKSTEAALQKMKAARPRWVLTTRTLAPAERLALQNLDPRRNLVALVEPRVRAESFDLLADPELRLLARRIWACRTLTGSSPKPDAAKTYRETAKTDSDRLRHAIDERYGVYIAWHRQGATGSKLDDTWFETIPFEPFTAARLREVLVRDHTNPTAVADALRGLWTDYLNKPLATLGQHLETTPGMPMLLAETDLAEAARGLVKERVFALAAPDNRIFDATTVGQANSEALAATVLVPHPAEAPPPLRPPTHDDVRATWNEAEQRVDISWRYPAPEHGWRMKTLIQRYTMPRHWKPETIVNLDVGETHDANRYRDDGTSASDGDGLARGTRYYYYVFLELYRGGPNDAPEFILSERREVDVPHEATPQQRDVILVPPQDSLQKLIAETEKRVLSGKLMKAEDRVRKIRIRIDHVSDEPAQKRFEALSKRMGSTPEVQAAFDVTVRGELNRGQVLDALKTLPKIADARYSAELHLKVDGVSDTLTSRG